MFKMIRGHALFFAPSGQKRLTWRLPGVLINESGIDLYFPTMLGDQVIQKTGD